jgi:branched-chain amino acid transport system substrate-binding protein
MRRVGLLAGTAVAAVLCLVTACSSSGSNSKGGGSSASAAASGGSSSGNGSCSGSSGSYTFAFTGPLSGPVAPFIGPAQQGLSDYFKNLNSKGGVNCHQIKFESTDIETDTGKAVAAYRQYVANKDVLALTGLGISSQIEPIASRLDRDGIPAISITSGDPALLPYNKWYFSFGDALAGEGTASLSYVLSKNPNARIAYFSYDTPAEEDLAKSITAEIKNSTATLVNKTLVPPTATDVSVQIGNLLKSKPDWIINGGATASIATSAVNSLKTNGFAGKMILVAAGGDDSDFQLGGNNTFQYVATRNFRAPSETDIPAVSDLLTHVTGNKPTRQYYTSGWVLGEVMADALSKCGDSCDRSSYRDALEKVNLTDTGNLAGGPVGFTSTCHQGFRTSMIYTWDSAAKKPKFDSTQPYYKSGPCAG